MKTNYKISMYYDDYITHHENIIAYELQSVGNSIVFQTVKESINYLNINNINYVIERNIKETFKKIFILKKFVLLGLLIGVFGVYINSYRVQNIIFNIETPINNEIKNKIETSNKKVFFFNFSTIDYQVLSKELRSEYSCYEWITVSKNYDIIEVEIIKTGLDNQYVDDVYGNIVASKDGVVETFLVTKGDVLIERNQYVKEGDILIYGGYYEKLISPKGYVLAHTFEEETYIVNKVVKNEELTGEVESFFQLDIFNNLFDLKSNYIYNTFEEKTNALFKIPFLFTINKVYHYEKSNNIYNYDIETAVEYGYSKVEEKFNNNKILDEEILENCMLLSTKEYDDYFEITYLVKRLESIGKFEELI